jgi:hypothetical protein
MELKEFSVCLKVLLKSNDINSNDIITKKGLAGWIPIPPQIYIQALAQREKDRSPQTQTEEQIETVLPKKRIC